MVLEGNCPAEFNSIPIQTPKKKKKIEPILANYSYSSCDWWN